MRRAFAELFRAIANRLDPPKPGVVWPINGFSNTANTASGTTDVTYTILPPKGA